MTEHRIRCGDHVFHEPTGETWVVAWADHDTGELAWCGWPNGVALIQDCTLTKRASDDEHNELLDRVKDCGDSRASRAARLYANGGAA